MTDVQKPCVRSCVRPGTEDNPEHYPATHGAYCGRCWGRLDQALIQAPELAAHILGNITSTGGQSDDRVDSSRDAPLPFNQAAFDDVSELYSLLVYWCGIWADYLEVREIAPTARVWRRESGTVIGLPADTTPEKGAAEVGRMTRWLRDRLDVILTLAPEDVDEFDAGIKDVWRMSARWPRVEKPRYSVMPCPAEGCGKRLAVYPPAFAGDAQRVFCDNSHFYPEEEFDEIIAAFRQSQVEAAKRANTVAHLTRKYVTRKTA